MNRRNYNINLTMRYTIVVISYVLFLHVNISKVVLHLSMLISFTLKYICKCKLNTTVLRKHFQKAKYDILIIIFTCSLHMSLWFIIYKLILLATFIQLFIFITWFVSRIIVFWASTCFSENLVFGRYQSLVWGWNLK